jgi:hypothetical protein
VTLYPTNGGNNNQYALFQEQEGFLVTDESTGDTTSVSYNNNYADFGSSMIWTLMPTQLGWTVTNNQSRQVLITDAKQNTTTYGAFKNRDKWVTNQQDTWKIEKLPVGARPQPLLIETGPYTFYKTGSLFLQHQIGNMYTILGGPPAVPPAVPNNIFTVKDGLLVQNSAVGDNTATWRGTIIDSQYILQHVCSNLCLGFDANGWVLYALGVLRGSPTINPTSPKKPTVVPATFLPNDTMVLVSRRAAFVDIVLYLIQVTNFDPANGSYMIKTLMPNGRCTFISSTTSDSIIIWPCTNQLAPAGDSWRWVFVEYGSDNYGVLNLVTGLNFITPDCTASTINIIRGSSTFQQSDYKPGMYLIQNNAYTDVTAYVFLLLVGVDHNTKETYYTLRLANNTQTANCVDGDTTNTSDTQLPTLPCTYPGSEIRCSNQGDKFTCGNFKGTSYWFVRPQTYGGNQNILVYFTNTVSGKFLSVDSDTQDFALDVNSGVDTNPNLLWDLQFVNKSF